MRKSIVVSIACVVVLTLAPLPQMDVARAGGMPVRAFLCNTAAHAIAFVQIVASGQSEEIARARIGRDAQPDACGRYVGIATVVSETSMVEGGLVYALTEYRFAEDDRLAWRAELDIAPPPRARVL